MIDTIIVTLFTAGISSIGYMLARYAQSLDNELLELKKKHELLKKEVEKARKECVTHGECKHRRTELRHHCDEHIRHSLDIYPEDHHHGS